MESERLELIECFELDLTHLFELFICAKLQRLLCLQEVSPCSRHEHCDVLPRICGYEMDSHYIRIGVVQVLFNFWYIAAHSHRK